MRGQVFTVAKLHYINGVVYFVAQEDSTGLSTLAKHEAETTKSGNVKHPEVRVRTLVRFAEGLGLVTRPDKATVRISELGRRYYEARATDKWGLSNRQKEILRDHILSDPARSPTIHAIASLLSLVEKGHTGDSLARQYAIAIEKDEAWQSDVTYEGFTNFGLSYLKELGFLEKAITPQSSGTGRSARISQATAKRTLLFTWNPDKWEWEDLPRAVYEANIEGRYLDKWSCGLTRDISPGDRVFLMRLGVPPKGIMGSGVVVSEPFEGLHWDPERAERGDTVYRVELLLDVLSDLPILTEETLTSGALGEHNWFPQASGTHIPPKVAEQLEAIWSQTTGAVFMPPDPEDIPRLRTEGTKRTRLVTTFERNPEARKECLRHYGARCQVCGFLFEEHYGPIGEGFIHVHHVVPVSEIQQEYEVDPIDDLRPVCPNCHAMLHKRTPPYTIAELTEIMDGSKS